MVLLSTAEVRASCTIMEQSARKIRFILYSKKNFKVQLDRFWANEEIYYDYKTNISCTGSRSNYDVDLEWFLLLKFMCKYCIFTMDWTSRQAMLRPHWTILLLLLLLLAVLALSQSPIEGLHITHYSPLPLLQRYTLDIHVHSRPRCCCRSVSCYTLQVVGYRSACLWSPHIAISCSTYCGWM